MQPSPYSDDGRWRVSMESKLDKALDLLNGLGTNYQTLDLRVKNLENAPAVQATRHQQQQQTLFQTLGCSFQGVLVLTALASIFLGSVGTVLSLIALLR